LHYFSFHGQRGAPPSLNCFGSSMKINHADVSYVRRNEDINRVGSEANTGNKILSDKKRLTDDISIAYAIVGVWERDLEALCGSLTALRVEPHC